MTECDFCKYYDKDEGYCTALICTPISCDELLPCEEMDALTLYVEGSRNEEDFDIDSFDDCYYDSSG